MYARRLVTIPGYVLAWMLCIGGAPIWLPVCAVVDLLRRRSVALRCAAFLTVYFSSELLGLAACAGLSVWKIATRPDVARWRDVHYRLQTWWATTVFGGIVQLFGLRIEVDDAADLGRGPYLLLVRHASSADTLLASALIGRPHGTHLRYVLKNEIRWDPCIDVVGHRLPHVFVDRHAADSDSEIARVKGVGRDLGPRDGVLIYPEGTRFSAAKRARVLERVRAGGDPAALAAAESLTHVLPPRPGGVLALLAAAPNADVVVCAHTGFEGTASIGQIWRGALVGRTVRVQFRRVPRAEIPADADAALAWLRSEWRRVDAWVRDNRPVRGGPSAILDRRNANEGRESDG
jgi:1-acyl-sn-glycerol-3-phosphate acyltransferase